MDLQQIVAGLSVVFRGLVLITLWCCVVDAFATKDTETRDETYRWKVALGVGAALALALMLR